VADGNTALSGSVGGPDDHAACERQIARLLSRVAALEAALRCHVPAFTDPEGVVLCGGCLRPAPCPDAALAGGQS
jgi:hypothetical protein